MYKTVYVMDNDTKMANAIVLHLSECEYATTSFSSGLEMLLEFQKKSCDLIVIDSDASIVNGYDFTREIRKSSDVPIIMVSNRVEKESAILGFDAGCDDFLVKPINLRELSTKVRIIFKRMNNLPEAQKATLIVHSGLELNLNAHTAKLNGQAISLTPKEFSLLVLLLRNKNLVFSREQIIQSVWQYDTECDTRQVDHLIKRLRKKIKLYSEEFKIDTVWGLGYKLSS